MIVDRSATLDDTVIQNELLEEQSTADYYGNLLRMSIMWSACSFSFHLLNFMNKYLEGSIFTNNYVEGVAGIIGTGFGTVIYTRYGQKTTFLFSFTMALFGGTMIFLIETGFMPMPVFLLRKFSGSPKF